MIVYIIMSFITGCPLLFFYVWCWCGVFQVRGVGAGGIVSSAYCLLYKLFTLKLTRKQVIGLLNHQDSSYIRALGFMYIRQVHYHLGQPTNVFLNKCIWYRQLAKLCHSSYLDTPGQNNLTYIIVYFSTMIQSRKLNIFAASASFIVEKVGLISLIF